MGTGILADRPGSRHINTENPRRGQRADTGSPAADERRGVSGGGTTGSTGDAHEVNLAATHQQHSLGTHEPKHTALQVARTPPSGRALCDRCCAPTTHLAAFAGATRVDWRARPHAGRTG